MVMAAFTVAAFSASGALTPVAADAASSAFAGKYRGVPPGVYVPWNWTFAINNGGKVSGKAHNEIGFYFDGSLTGRVDASGRMDCKLSYAFRYPDGGTSQSGSFRANASLNAAGDIVGTTDTGIAFTWTRQ